MRVESKDDRMAQPEECYRCGYDTPELTRFYHYGPGHNVDWLCPYCARITDDIVSSVASMLNELEKRLAKTGDKNEG